MCNPWAARLEVLLLWVMVPRSAGKPAMPPVLKEQPFSVFWAFPTMHCKHFFKVNIGLQIFNIITNPFEIQSGSTIAIFYPNELGYSPYISPNETSFNGGIPQNLKLSDPLRKTATDIAKSVSWWRSEGLVIIDWESWKPQWNRNWGIRAIYQNHSLAFTRYHHPDWSETKVRRVTQQEFENTRGKLMNITLILALEMRPRRLWGFCLYPDCYNYDYKINGEVYMGYCPNEEIFRNDQLL